MSFWKSLNWSPVSWEQPERKFKVCEHRGDRVRVGNYEIYAGAERDLLPKDIKDFDILVPLAGASSWIWRRGFKGLVLAYPIKDRGGVEGPWREFLNMIIGLLDEGKKILVYCMGGHGRTGTFLASLIALLEQPEDPIAEVRKRYCREAVETEDQARAIFKLLGRPLPKKYIEEFNFLGFEYEPPKKKERRKKC